MAQQGQQTTLFDCCSDPTLCLYGWCCGPCVYGETDDIMGEGSCMMGALKVIFCGSCTVCCIAPGRRERLRQHFSIEPECMGTASPGSAARVLLTARRGE